MFVGDVTLNAGAKQKIYIPVTAPEGETLEIDINKPRLWSLLDRTGEAIESRTGQDLQHDEGALEELNVWAELDTRELPAIPPDDPGGPALAKGLYILQATFHITTAGDPYVPKVWVRID